MDRNAIVAYLMFDELRGGVHCIFESVGCLDGLTIYHTHIALLPIDCPVPPGESSAFGVCGWRLRRGGEETLERWSGRGGMPYGAVEFESSTKRPKVKRFASHRALAALTLIPHTPSHQRSAVRRRPQMTLPSLLHLLPMHIPTAPPSICLCISLQLLLFLLLALSSSSS